MTRRKKLTEGTQLRKRAEKLLVGRMKATPKIMDGNVKKLVHELQVHQIELEMQNDELRKAQAEIEESRTKYSDLYDFAPVGYFTFSSAGEILEVNLTGASLLGVERTKLIHNSFSTFVAPEFGTVFRNHRLNVLRSKENQRCELKLLKKGKAPFYAALRSIAVAHGKSFRIRTVVSDITHLKQMEQHLRQRTDELSKANELLETTFSSVDVMIAYMDKDFNFIKVNRAYAEADEKSTDFFPDKNHFALYPNEENEAIFKNVVETGEPYSAYAKPFVYAGNPGLGITYWDWNLHPVKDPEGRVGGVVLSLMDVTERMEIQRRIEATNSLLSLFVKGSTRKEYLDSVIELIQPWSGCRCVGIRVLDEKDYIPYESYVGFSQDFWESENCLSTKYDQCACIRVVTGTPDPQDLPVMTPGGSFHCENIYQFVGSLPEEEKARFRGVCIQQGFRSVAIVPIRHREKILGAIHLADEGENKVHFKNVQFIEAIAPLIGEAAIRFNLEEALKESEKRLRHLSNELITVQENERARISREIHDSLGQTLSAIKFKVEEIIHEVQESKRPKLAKSLETLLPIILESIEECRRIQMDLRPSLLDDLGLLPTLEWFCREFQKIYSGIRVEKEIRIAEKEIPDLMRTILFRITQEAFNNIAKYSKTDVARLCLIKTEDKIELSVEDQGVGFDMANIKRGLGLASMRERAQLTGGTFFIESTVGKGTLIKASWTL